MPYRCSPVLWSAQGNEVVQSYTRARSSSENAHFVFVIIFIPPKKRQDTIALISPHIYFRHSCSVRSRQVAEKSEISLPQGRERYVFCLVSDATVVYVALQTWVKQKYIRPNVWKFSSNEVHWDSLEPLFTMFFTKPLVSVSLFLYHGTTLISYEFRSYWKLKRVLQIFIILLGVV